MNSLFDKFVVECETLVDFLNVDGFANKLFVYLYNEYFFRQLN